MEVAEIAPIIGDFNVLHLRIRELPPGILRPIPKADIDAVVILGFLLFLPCFEALYGVGLHEWIVALVLPCAVVLVVAGEREEQYFAVLFLRVVDARRNKLYFDMVGVLGVVYDAASEKVLHR